MTRKYLIPIMKLMLPTTHPETLGKSPGLPPEFFHIEKISSITFLSSVLMGTHIYHVYYW